MLHGVMGDPSPSFSTSLVSGGTAGLAAHIALFPLDTIKTRLQSKHSFQAAGGFRNIYSGIGLVALASAPQHALFFCTYETIKKVAKKERRGEDSAAIHFVAASLAEIVGCLVKVPVEVVKQRRQAGISTSNSLIVRQTLKKEGVRGLYRGSLPTMATGHWPGRFPSAWSSSRSGSGSSCSGPAIGAWLLGPERRRCVVRRRGAWRPR